MPLDPQPPQGLTLTLGPVSDQPPPIPLNPPHPQNLPNNVRENPYNTLPAEGPEEDSTAALNAAITQAGAPSLYTIDYNLVFNETLERVKPEETQEVFNASIKLIIDTLQGGPEAPNKAAPDTIGTADWARLACALLAAIGQGYNLQYSQTLEVGKKKEWAEAPDPNPISANFPTLFHRIAATADYLGDQVTGDQTDVDSWVLEAKANLHDKVGKAAQKEVEETWKRWKAEQIRRRATAQEAIMAGEVRRRNVEYFQTVAAELGFRPPLPPQMPPGAPSDTPRGKKRTASGSLATPRVEPRTPGSSKDGPRDTGTPRGRPNNPAPPAHRWADPSPTPQPRKKAPPASQVVLNLSPNVRLNLGPKVGALPPASAGQLDISTITAAIQSAMGPAIQTAMAQYTARLLALERSSAPTPVVRAYPHPPPGHAEQPSYEAQQPDPPTPADHEGEEFTLISRNGKGRKSKGKANAAGPAPAQMPQPLPPPATYANTAATATNIQQPQPQKKVGTPPPAITEVMVLRAGGYLDCQKEDQIRARAADAIVREVRLKMAKVTVKPIRLRAGRWSISPRSKGNFVFSFDGNVPFDIIKSYKHILLDPFGGYGGLCPSMGWTRFLVNGAPVWDDDDTPFSPNALLDEVRTLPGLKKAFFAMQPRWLTHTDRILSTYSSVTFAISDPDGTISNTLLNNRAALFGKEVTIRKWIDKPAFIQCSRCHALGHNKASRVCTLSKDSVRCYRCGGAHISEAHDKQCTKKHNVAGICDCKPKCLNCNNEGHDCKDQRCPARDRYRPKNARKPKKGKATSRDPNWADKLYSWEQDCGWGEEEEGQNPPNDATHNNHPLLHPPANNTNNARPPPAPATTTTTITTADPHTTPAAPQTSPTGSQVMNIDYDLEDPFTGRPAIQEDPLAGWEAPILPLPKIYSPSRAHGDANFLPHD